MPAAIRLFLLGYALLLAAPAGAQAAERCPGAETTLAISQCLARRLEASDSDLARALSGVAAQARREPGGRFLPLWRSFVATHAGGEDPAAQLRMFQTARRQLCRYTNSISLQGSGYGLFVTACELDLNDTLLRQLRD